MSALIVVILLTHFHMLGPIVALLVVGFLIYLALGLCFAVLSLIAWPFVTAGKWIDSKISFRQPLDPIWRRKENHIGVIILVAVTSPLWLAIAFVTVSGFFH